MTPIIFRSLIVCVVLLVAGATSVDIVFPSLMSEAISNAIESEPTPSGIDRYPIVFVALALPVVIATLAGLIGLFFFKRWGRAMALYSTLFSFLLVAFTGTMCSSALSYSLSEAGSTLWGTVLALAYFSSIKERFSKENR